ncbi:MAG TPA: hypothetical protein VLI54_03830 [Bacillota bacterium]|nr:hypothetical protein [Bacillota bacterium]
MIEIEQRYKVFDPQATIAALETQGVILQQENRVIDCWFAPRTVQSQADQDVWFDKQHGVAYRIRKIALPGDTFDIALESKQHTTANNHNTFNEEVIMRGDEAAMQAWLAQKDYYNWLTIDKLRRRFASPHPELEVVMDTVAGVRGTLGIDTVLEIEYQGEATRDAALQAIANFAGTLGFTPDMRFDKSLTVESMRVLARFSTEA